MSEDDAGHDIDYLVDMVIPAFNEEPNIQALFDALAPVQHHLRNVVVADNNSTDNTASMARERGAVVVHESQRGYGAACQAALRWIDKQDRKPDGVVFFDADLSDDPNALETLLIPLMKDDVDIVIGSRVRLAEKGALNIVQRFGNRLACGMMRVLGGKAYSDLGPFRSVSYEALQHLHMSDRTWGWTVELQMKAALLNMNVLEVDVPYRCRHSGTSKISGTIRGVWAAGTKIISTIVTIWLQRTSLRQEAQERRQ